jgi:hypothetical protein
MEKKIRETSGEEVAEYRDAPLLFVSVRIV